MYIVMECDLHPITSIDIIFKHVDDTNLLVLENTDVGLNNEYNHIKHWAPINKMCFNERRVKLKNLFFTDLNHVNILYTIQLMELSVNQIRL